MDNRILQLLESRDPARREKGIKALASLGTDEALEQLALIYKTEHDPRLRKLAVKAGQYIKKQQQERYYDDLYDDDELYDEDDYDDDDLLAAAPQEVSQEDRIKSKNLMNKAIAVTQNGLTRKSVKQAREYMHQAFELYPDIQHNGYYLKVAAEILRIPEEEVAAELLGHAADDVDHTVIKNVKKGGKIKHHKRKDGFDYEGEATWTTASTDLAIYWLLTSASLVAIVVLLIHSITGLFREIYDAALAQGEIALGAETDNLITGFLHLILSPEGLTGIIFIVVLIITANVLRTMIQLWVMNIIAGAMLGGDGTLRGLIHNSIYFLIVTDIISFMYIAFVTYTVFAALSEFTGASILYPGTSADILVNNAFGARAEMLSTLEYLSYLGSFFYVMIWAWLIGRAYHFGTAKGCYTQIIFYIITFMCSCFTIFVLSTAAMQS